MGLNFYTTNIVNSASDFKKIEEGGINAGWLKVKNYLFNPAWIVSVAEQTYTNPTYASFTLTDDVFKAVASGKFGRIDIKIEFEGENPAIGANNFDVQKGLVLSVEFKGQEPSADVIKRIKKDKLFFYGKELFVEDEETAGMFVAVDDCVRIKEIKVLQFDEISDYNEEIAVNAGTGTLQITTVQGKSEFGGYSYLSKNIILPTAANRRWAGVKQDEAPIVGGKYDQYIITYKAPACNDSMQAVGGHIESVTTHVFWVEQSISADFDTALTVDTAPVADEIVYELGE